VAKPINAKYFQPNLANMMNAKFKIPMPIVPTNLKWSMLSYASHFNTSNQEYSRKDVITLINEASNILEFTNIPGTFVQRIPKASGYTINVGIPTKKDRSK
jgi:predicted oxidoreductase